MTCSNHTILGNPWRTAGYCGQLLRTCADQLCHNFQLIFNLSLSQQGVPRSWKHSIIESIAKCSSPKSSNDFRPVALTSLVMKSFEKMIKEAVLLQVGDQLDPLQFASVLAEMWRMLWSHYCTLFLAIWIELRFMSDIYLLILLLFLTPFSPFCSLSDWLRILTLIWIWCAGYWIF